MKWVGYALGIVVGATFGFWVYGAWEQLEGVGAGPAPSFDLVVPMVLFVVAAAGLAFAGRRRPPRR